MQNKKLSGKIKLQEIFNSAYKTSNAKISLRNTNSSQSKESDKINMHAISQEGKFQKHI